MVPYLVEKIAEAKLNRTFVITGSEDTPIQAKNGRKMYCHDLSTTHEEADVIIIQQCYHLAKEGVDELRIECDDTDVFDLACHFFL